MVERPSWKRPRSSTHIMMYIHSERVQCTILSSPVLACSILSCRQHSTEPRLLWTGNHTDGVGSGRRIGGSAHFSEHSQLHQAGGR